MKGLLVLALRHAAYHRWRTLVLVGCVAVTLFLPAVTAALMDRYDRELRVRAADTPLLVGASGNRFDLVLASLYFRQTRLDTVPWSELLELQAMDRGVCIPLHFRATAQGRPLVATTIEYAELRGLALAEGTDPLRIGEVTLGATVAAELGLAVGDVLYSDQVESYDIARPPSLRLRVVGVYAPSSTADDGAVFADVKTAWAVEGIAHGHADESEVDESLVVARTEDDGSGGGTVQLSGAVIEDAEMTDDALARFHLHAGPEELPLSAILVVPRDAKSGTLLNTDVNLTREWQSVTPSVVIDDLLSVVFRVKRFFDLVGGVLAATTAVLVGLVFALSSRLRATEMRTLDRLGAPRGTAWMLYGLELGSVLALGAALAAGSVAATLALLPDLVQAL